MRKNSHDRLQSSDLKKKHKLTEVTLQVLKAVSMTITVFRNAMLYSLPQNFISHLSWLKTVVLNSLQVNATCPESSIWHVLGDNI